MQRVLIIYEVKIKRLVAEKKLLITKKIKRSCELGGEYRIRTDHLLPARQAL
jgi:hypothetical protein